MSDKLQFVVAGSKGLPQAIDRPKLVGHFRIEGKAQRAKREGLRAKGPTRRFGV